MSLLRCLSQSFATLLFCGIIAACSELPPADNAQSVSGEPPVAPSPPPPYVVRYGDSISKIAAALGLDYLELAELNELAPPYTIFEGQVLSTNVGELTAEQLQRVAQARRELIRAIRTVEGTAADTTGQGDSREQAGSGSVAGGVEDAASDVSTAVRENTAILESTVDSAAQSDLVVDGNWAWPASGRVLSEFSATENKGLDIAVAPGEPVRAVADGVVQHVYDNAPRYGGLVVVKHDERHLGFYGYLQDIRVSVGEKVALGQPLADASGDNGARRVHFELRRNADPVNPREVFPAR